MTMLPLCSHESRASQPPFNIEDETAGICAIVRDALPPQVLSSLASHEDIQAVFVERVHFSSRRPIQMQLMLHGRSGWRQTLLAEWLGVKADEYAHQERGRLSKSRRAQLARTETDGIVSVSNWGLVVRRPGLDAKLPGLRLLHHPEEATDLLEQFTENSMGPTKVELVAHRLGKRAVLRVTTTKNGVYYVRLRGINSKSGAVSFTRHEKLFEQLSAHPNIALPEPLGYNEKLGAAIYYELPGSPAELSGSAAITEGRFISHALQALQTAQDLSFTVHSAADERALLLQWYARAQLYFPELAKSFRAPLEQVTIGLEQLSEQSPVLAHRDLHQKQMLMTKFKVGILDFDTACLSHPALDLGNLQAHVYFECKRNGYHPASIETALESALPRLSRRDIKMWRCSALLRLAMIYAFTHEPESIVNALISEATS